ncbi:MAG: pyridinium-3,5-bisthiocarboxylic acid mononucleotide nickel chelatase [Chloroflexota bacterium]|nr:pyridinium-3,5-bisthiocarboxylic acid mononucleotide nickel chelatase [Chloroflexota bacterium]
MTVAYFDCFAGISGDMTLGALIDAGANRAVVDAAVEALRLGDEVKVEVRREVRGHVGGTRVVIDVQDRTERTVPSLRSVVEDAEVPDGVKRHAIDAINSLARVEAKIHGVSEDKLHLHELGGADTLVDLVGAFWLLHDLEVTQVYASPLPAPRGRKGEMPLPAPASLAVLAGTGAIFQDAEGGRELVTPTGAVILAAVAKFERPAMSLNSIGYGIGARETPGNALAVWIGEEATTETGVTVIETNIDDMAPNLLAALCEDLMAAGALDVTVTPALMKKGRSGHLLTVMSTPDLVARLTDHLLRHSTTLGVRLQTVQRVLARRRIVEVQTPLGTARVKVKELGGKPVDVSPEYEDCRRIARESGRDVREVMRLVAETARRELGLP